MMVFRRLISGLRVLFSRQRVEPELDEELRAFLDMAIAQKMRAGMTPKDATRAARLELGGVEVVKDRVRDVSWESVVESLWQDLRRAGRTLARTPGFSVTAAFTLALGIGANVTIFAIVNAVLLRPLAYPDAERIVSIRHRTPGLSLQTELESSPGLIAYYREHSRTLTRMAAFRRRESNSTGSGHPARVRAPAPFVWPGAFSPRASCSHWWAEC